MTDAKVIPSTTPPSYNVLPMNSSAEGRYMLQIPNNGPFINGQGNNDAVNFAVIMKSGGQLTNGPSGTNPYWNMTGGVGINWTSDFTCQNTTRGSAGIRFEGKYYDGSNFGNEIHISGLAYDAGGNEVRVMSWFIPDQSANINSGLSCSTQIGRWSFLQWNSGKGPLMIWDFRNGDKPAMFMGDVSWTGNPQFYYYRNNDPFCAQLKSDGSGYVNMPYLGSQQQYLFSAGISGDGGAHTDGITGNKAWQSIRDTNSASNDAGIMYYAASGITGTRKIVDAYATTSGNLTGFRLTQQGAGNVIGSRLSGLNDICVFATFDGNGTSRDWSVWAEQSSGNLIICSTETKSDARFSIPRSTLIPQSKSYCTEAVPFANLPTTKNVGTRAIISDGVASPVWMAIAASGGTTVTPVFWNGSNWVNG